VAQASSSNQLTLMDQSLRVGVDILDRLMNLVGELVLSRNQLLQLVASAENSPFISPVQQLNRVTSGLQEAVMRTRMQPIGNAWSKLPRIVRDLQGTVGKEIDLVMQGAETEIDRQILQAIQDPLTHCVRNAADHGLESPQDRLEIGKPSRGTITLRAFQEGGQIHIEVSDDGRGMDVDAIRRKGVEKGLISQEQATRLSDSEILNLVFEPGFSTAKKVTEISGRGVGLDVVRTNIEKVGGSVELKSELAVGTTIRIRIPLTLAIVPALIVGAKLGAFQEVYAIPQLAVVELVRMSSEGRDRVENVQGTQVLRLRDRLLPLVELSEILSGEKREARDEGFVIVVQVGEARVGIRVDEIFDTQEIVVKPVGRLVREIPLYAGSTILGDGRVIMILDVSGVAMQSGALTSGKVASTEKARQVDLMDHGTDASGELGAEMTRLLVFSSDIRDSVRTAPLAVALAQVARLEEVDPEKIERVEDGYVLQYRGSLLPVMRPDGGPVSELRFKPDGKVGVIVFNGKQDGTPVSVGLLVSEIIDIIDAPTLARKEQALRSRGGVSGSMIVQGRATEVIDVDFYLSKGRTLGAANEAGRGVAPLQQEAL
jgi:two-component system chemotaxis sensor kinase CheA